MLRQWLTNCFLLCVLFIFSAAAGAAESQLIDRAQLVNQQIVLLQHRVQNANLELINLNKQQRSASSIMSAVSSESANKALLSKAELEAMVAKSNLETIAIELSDAEQTLSWLEKSSQDIENKINVMAIFKRRSVDSQMVNMAELKADLAYQHQLFSLEKTRVDYLQQLKKSFSTIFAIEEERHKKLSTILKSQKILHVKQQQASDELKYQQMQNAWLEKMTVAQNELSKLDSAKNKAEYLSLEADIYYANEAANIAYTQSLIARYQDQVDQMRLTLLKDNAISLLNEMAEQQQMLFKQVDRLQTALKRREALMNMRVAELNQDTESAAQGEVQSLKVLGKQYEACMASLSQMSINLTDFRGLLDRSLQEELASRQGLPQFGMKMFLDLGREIFLLPALTFQISKDFTTHLFKTVYLANPIMWIALLLGQCFVLSVSAFAYLTLKRVLSKQTEWRDHFNGKWLTLQWLKRNFIDLFLTVNTLALFFAFGVSLQYTVFAMRMALVWLVFKSVLTVARLCLIETTHDANGHDVRLYYKLKWAVISGGVITAFTVFIHQLPLVYELKTLTIRLFLLFLLVVSLLLLRFREVVPNVILANMEKYHSYFEKCIRVIALLLPALMFSNAIIGLCGYVNLVMTVSWYECVFLLVLVGYLLMRGVLSDAMESLSRLVIHYFSNGWLLTEAFLKPLDKLLRVALFLASGVVLFLLYGWDKQSPIVERLSRLLDYHLVSALNTTITPLNLIEMFMVISVFYWTAKWTREFVYRLLVTRTQDMGIRNSFAILSQYSVVLLGALISLHVSGIDLHALTVIAGMLAFGVGLGLRDLVNNFACGFLILLERPLRVGDIVTINDIEGEVMHIGSRAISVKTWDRLDMLVPNADVFNKPFINWTFADNIVRTVMPIKISYQDNPHAVRLMIQSILSSHKDVLKEPKAEVLMREMNESVIAFDVRYYVNIREVSSRFAVMSSLLIQIWDVFHSKGIKPPYPHHAVYVNDSTPALTMHATQHETEFTV